MSRFQPFPPGNHRDESPREDSDPNEPPLWFKTIGLIILTVIMVLVALIVIGLLAWGTKHVWGQVF